MSPQPKEENREGGDRRIPEVLVAGGERPGARKHELGNQGAPIDVLDWVRGGLWRRRDESRRPAVALGHGGGAPTRGREGGRAEEDQHRVGKAMGYLDWR